VINSRNRSVREIEVHMREKSYYSWEVAGEQIRREKGVVARSTPKLLKTRWFAYSALYPQWERPVGGKPWTPSRAYVSPNQKQQGRAI